MKRSLRGVTLMIVGWFFLFMSIYIAALEVCATPVIASGLRGCSRSRRNSSDCCSRKRAKCDGRA